MRRSLPYQRWFLYFVLYNLLFLGLQFGYIVSESGSFINAIPLPALVYIWLILTAFIHLGLYIFLSVLQTLLMWGLSQQRLGLASLERWHMNIWSFSVCALLTSNAYFFPLSRFSQLFLPELPYALLLILMVLSVVVLGLLLINALYFASKRYPVIIVSSLFILLGSLTYSTIKPTPETKYDKQANNTPNIILIGVDSLAPNSINSTDTPTLYRFIKESVLFNETISPLAHTYPAWTSILTGLYPQHHNARYNLMQPDLVKSSRSIAWSLQQLGYRTLFATDDRRFNNLGKEFGFQTIVGPKLGANDVLLGTFNDFPLSNLLVNLPISGRLFPYNYINRASHFTYYPRSFDNALKKALLPGNRVVPSFIAVHFTLPHWPYAWAGSSPAQVNDEFSLEERGQLYLSALQQVDQQVAHLLNVLHQDGYTDNSLVMLLSDHGEALYVPGSRQTSPASYQATAPSKFADYIKRKTSTALEMSVGHGSDLLSTSQYHCILAIKIFQHGQRITLPTIIDTRVSLIDIAPTIYAFLDLSNHQQVDGISLLKSIVNHTVPLPKRAFIMESGMLPNQFLTFEKAALMGKKFFTIDPRNGQLHVRNDELTTLDAMKLYAVIEGHWILALYPDDNGYIPITQNLSNGKWTDELTSDFAKSSPAILMLNHLRQFYKKNWALVSEVQGEH